ncbi:MAG: hypothetical protein PHT33_14780 [bacterium]|nr:hypothetical protein [bacterium]
MDKVTIEKIEFKGWKNCVRISNGIIELIATTDVGPRIISFGFLDGPNEFAVFDEQAGMIGGDEWRIYGGHRLWHSPEKAVRTYSPDNTPIEMIEEDGKVILRQPTESLTGITKEIELEMSPDEPKLSVVHRITNDNLWAVDLAPWALSVMAPGGTAVVPQPEYAEENGFAPNRSVSVWPYASMGDDRINWGHDYIMLKQDTMAKGPFKFGLNADSNWCAYANNGHLFVKLFDYIDEALYPDYEASVECYTNDRMLELETLGPLVYLEPGAVIEHPEGWVLLKGIEHPQGEKDIKENIQPEINRILRG